MVHFGTLILRSSSEEVLAETTTKAKEAAVKEADRLREHHQRKLLQLRSIVCERHPLNNVNNSNLSNLNSNSNCDNSKWVVNLSSKQLNSHELKILQKGLNFAVAPKSIPVSKFLSEVEVSIKNLDDSDKDLVRAEVCNITKSFNNCTIKSNITPEESKAIATLKKDKSIVVSKADKGNCTVILDTQDYNNKMFNLLSDTGTYKEIKKDPTKKIERCINSKLLSLKRQGKIDDSNYYRIRSTDGVISRMYGLVKIHKIDNPMRPIVSLVGSPLYNLSKYLSDIISPLVGNTSSNVKNSFDFVNFIQSCNWTGNDIMVSFDVVSLFTKVPTDLAIEVIKNRLENDSTLSNRTNLSIEDIVDLVSFCLSNNDFVFRDKYFHQSFGCSMGSPISVISANLVMEDIERRIFLNCDFNVHHWKRFVDDVWALMPANQVDDFLKFINSIETSIKFTCEKEQSRDLPFLDVFISRLDNNKFETKVYRKPTHTNRYLDFNSNHPFCQKLSVGRSLFNRANKLCSNVDDRNKELDIVKVVLNNNCYPKHMYRRMSSDNNKPNKSNPKGYAHLPYVKNYSERIARVLNKYNIKTLYKPFNKLQDIFGLPKDPIQPSQRCGVVYQVPCADCGKVYIGQTGNSLNTRLHQHQAACRLLHKEKSALAQHSIEEDHSIDWNGAKVIANQPKWRHRLFEEAFHTQAKRDQAINRCEEFLPRVYKPLTGLLSLT